MDLEKLRQLLLLLTEFQKEHNFQMIPHSIKTIETQLHIAEIKQRDTSWLDAFFNTNGLLKKKD